MSANLELVRSIYADHERGDFRSTEWAHPEIEYVVVGGPEPGRWTGLAGMAASFRNFLTSWDDFRIEPEEYRALDDERVLVLDCYSGHGKTSGVELGRVRARAASIFHIRDGKVRRLALYWDRERALADLGLDPEGDAAGSP